MRNPSGTGLLMGISLNSSTIVVYRCRLWEWTACFRNQHGMSPACDTKIARRHRLKFIAQRMKMISIMKKAFDNSLALYSGLMNRCFSAIYTQFISDWVGISLLTLQNTSTYGVYNWINCGIYGEKKTYILLIHCENIWQLGAAQLNWASYFKDLNPKMCSSDCHGVAHLTIPGMTSLLLEAMKDTGSCCNIMSVFPVIIVSIYKTVRVVRAYRFHDGTPISAKTATFFEKAMWCVG